ncbi:Ribose-5-phosphate isomerase [Orchesella cincta]|uniref:ribose-5-phosphate isomerase n=1 Tax=Orchesella cincta TaxID=48709 RepID=A0A1D2N7J4_ORCCI|nr:Ribose-5-phosphate isomerase [Orchesella cincta]
MLRRLIFLGEVNGKQLLALGSVIHRDTHIHGSARKLFCGPLLQKVSAINMGDDQKSLLDKAKKLAAYQAVDDHVKLCKTSKCIITSSLIGWTSSGHREWNNAVYAVERIAQRAREENLNLICIPTSFQAKNLIISNGLQLSELDVHYPIDVTIDGCDECDQDLNVIKGGGGCLLQEKIVASASKKLIIVGDFSKESRYLGEKWKKGIPLEVAQMGARVVLEKLQKFTDSVGGSVIPTKVRQAVNKMGPVITDNGNFIVDFQFGDAMKTGELHNAQSVESWLKSIPGILETGLFVKMANQAYFGQPDGTVKSTHERIIKNGF